MNCAFVTSRNTPCKGKAWEWAYPTGKRVWLCRTHAKLHEKEGHTLARVRAGMEVDNVG